MTRQPNPPGEFKAWRQSLGLSLTQTAKALGLCMRQVNYLNSGKCGIKPPLRLAMELVKERQGKGLARGEASGGGQIAAEPLPPIPCPPNSLGHSPEPLTRPDMPVDSLIGYRRDFPPCPVMAMTERGLKPLPDAPIEQATPTGQEIAQPLEPSPPSDSPASSDERGISTGEDQPKRKVRDPSIWNK